MGYTLDPRPYGHEPLPLGQHSDSNSSDSEMEAESSSEKATKAGSEGMTIWEMMKRAEEGAARLEGKETPQEQVSFAFGASPYCS